jgi:two-component system heavy metal sensor histidine kinase CusS
VAGEARLGQADGRPVRITVARVYPERTALLAAYRWRILLAVVGAALSAALLSAWIAWRALAPLRRLSREAVQINVERLSTRLSEGNAPPEISRLIATLNTMLARLEDGFGRLSRFAADLAHEFRTPVGNLLGQSQVMLARPREAHEYQALLESNIEELERLARMIDSMLFLARAEHAELALDLRPVAIGEELARQVDYFEGLAEERGLTLVADGAGTLHADATLLRRALGNLVANAVRHARPGSAIRLTATRDADGWLLAVENEGEPLPEAALARLFDRFYRVDAARADAAPSSGLGLAIVRSIMALHGGEARVAQSGNRLRFTLRFPDSRGP